MNVFVVGAEKAGTTWLHKYFESLEAIYVSPTKEIGYFCSHDSNMVGVHEYERLGVEYYHRFYRAYGQEPLVAEIMPMYLCDPKAPARIHQYNPKAKIIILLRDPISRAYSHYWMARWKKNVRCEFEDLTLENDPCFLGRGLYAGQVEQYYNLFGRENVQVFFYEETFRDKDIFTSELAAFLGISAKSKGSFDKDTKVYAASEVRSAGIYNGVVRLNRFLHRSKLGSTLNAFAKSLGAGNAFRKFIFREAKYPAISPDRRKALLSQYEPDRIKLEQLLGRSVPAKWLEY